MNRPLLLLMAVSAGLVLAADEFRDPPAEARTKTWWHWQEYRINPEMMERELDAIAAAGIGGVQMFHGFGLAEKVLPRPVEQTEFLGAEWMKAVSRSLARCARNGLTFGMQNGAGWSGVGGPWIASSNSMKQVFAVERRVKGGEKVVMKKPERRDLPKHPFEHPADKPFLQDIAAFAFPVPEGAKGDEFLPDPVLAASHPAPNLTNLNIRAIYGIYNPKPEPGFVYEAKGGEDGGAVWLDFSWKTPVTVRTVFLKREGTCFSGGRNSLVRVLAERTDGALGEVAVVGDGWANYSDALQEVEYPIPATETRRIRLLWTKPGRLVVRDVHFSSRARVKAFRSKQGESTWSTLDAKTLPDVPGEAVAPADIHDITDRIAADGTLEYAPPADGREWAVVRVGMRDTQRSNQPTPNRPWRSTGPACDLMDAEVTKLHLDHYVQKIVDEEAKLGVKVIRDLVLDSWEQGCQNWTFRMEEEFAKRRGYSIRKYLPIYAGYLVGSRSETERVFRDARRTADEMIRDNFFRPLMDYAHAHGMRHHVEGFACNSGTFCGDALMPNLECDVPMTEAGAMTRIAASGAHLRGLDEVAYEAHTGAADWRLTPRDLKDAEDDFFLRGMTRIVFHTYGHNPMPECRFPGPSFSGYGVALQLGQTWWKYARPWQDYLARCQLMLRKGAFVADVAAFIGDGHSGPSLGLYDNPNSDRLAGLPEGYDYDLVNGDFLRNEMKAFGDGTFGSPAPNATRYRVLRFRPDDAKMDAATRAKAKELEKAGVKVVWPGGDLAAALAAVGAKPDVVTRGMRPGALGFVHRREGIRDVYFIARRGRFDNAEVGFRVTGRRPEIWNPLDGSKTVPRTWRVDGTYTYVPLPMDDAERSSRFVVFAEEGLPPAETASDKGSTTRTIPVEAIAGWTVHFKDELGCDMMVKSDELFDWRDRPEELVRTFSGTAVYTATLGIGQSNNRTIKQSGRLFLSLGRVDELARVKVNGRDCGIAWCAPYEVDVTEAVSDSQLLNVEIEVVNSWQNRMLADRNRPAAERRTWTQRPLRSDATSEPSGLKGPLSIRLEIR